MTIVSHGWAGPRRRRRGTSTVELALVLPVLVLVVAIACDFCRLFYYMATIANCARNGAVWASDPVTQTQSPYATVQAATIVDGASLSPALATSNVTSSTGADASGNATVTVTVNYTFHMVTGYLGFSTVPLQSSVTMDTSQTAPN